MTRLGDFLNFLMLNFLTKVAQMYIDFLGCFKRVHFMYKLLYLLFGHLLEHFGLLYISASGHTDQSDQNSDDKVK